MKLKKITIWTILFSSIFFQSCNQDKIVLEIFSNKYKSIDVSEFELIYVDDFSTWKSYYLEKKNDNYREEIEILVLKPFNYKKPDNSKIILSGLYRFEKRDSIVYETGFTENYDTLYYLINDGDKKEFKKGKYYYYYNLKPGSLDSSQRLYYEKHRDSIIKNCVNEVKVK